MAIHVLVIYGNEMGTQLVKSVIDKLKYQLLITSSNANGCYGNGKVNTQILNANCT